jgi:hypothetical protein
MLEVRAERRPDIDTLITQLKGELDEDYTPPGVKRHAHPKMHGCVQASLRVDDDLDLELRHGVFERPGREFRAWVRFSNALGLQHDSHFESRGMAIKLIDVVDLHGQGWLQPPSDEPVQNWETGTQDFVMATHDVFVLPDTKRYDYGEFAAAVRVSVVKLVAAFLRRRLYRGLFAALRSSFVLPTNPLAIRYFSQTPYCLGPHEVKLHARPLMTAALRQSLPNTLRFALRTVLINVLIEASEVRQIAWVLKLLGFEAKRDKAERFCERYLARRDHLRHSLMASLAQSAAQFEIMVQLRTDASMSTTDATVRWSERRSPYRRVAMLTIPRQVFWPASGMPREVLEAAKTMMERGENMSFSPWHGLRAHQPLGDINEARGRIYAAIAKYRREERNQVELPVPDADYDELRDVLQRGRLQV